MDRRSFLKGLFATTAMTSVRMPESPWVNTDKLFLDYGKTYYIKAGFEDSQLDDLIYERWARVINDFEEKLLEPMLNKMLELAKENE